MDSEESKNVRGPYHYLKEIKRLSSENPPKNQAPYIEDIKYEKKKDQALDAEKKGTKKKKENY